LSAAKPIKFVAPKSMGFARLNPSYALHDEMKAAKLLRRTQAAE
jgi:hypothetical protein